MEGVISVFHSDPDTTRSWDFVSLLEGTSLINYGEELSKNGNYGEDIIVGVIDTGKSFSLLFLEKHFILYTPSVPF